MGLIVFKIQLGETYYYEENANFSVHFMQSYELMEA
jgi:hypothetical protein